MPAAQSSKTASGCSLHGQEGGRCQVLSSDSAQGHRWISRRSSTQQRCTARSLTCSQAARSGPCASTWRPAASPLNTYDPASQRAIASLPVLVIDAASELIGAAGDEETPWSFTPLRTLETIFDYLSEAKLLAAPRTDERARSWFNQIAENYRSAFRLPAVDTVSGRPRHASAAVPEMSRRQSRLDLVSCDFPFSECHAEASTWNGAASIWVVDRKMNLHSRAQVSV